MVKHFPYEGFDVPDDSYDLVVTSAEAPSHLRTAAATLVELDRDIRAQQGWFARWWRGVLSRSLHRIADHVEQG